MKKAIRWAVSLGLLGLLLILVDLGEVYGVIRSADPAFLSLAVVVMLADRLLMAGKWVPLLKISYPQARTGAAVRAYFAASFAGLLLPASVGGDVLRTYGIGRDDSAIAEVGASVVVERVLGLLATGLVALGILWIALRSDLPMASLVPWAAGCAIVGIGAATLPFSSSVREAVRKLFSLVRKRKWTDVLERFGSSYVLYRGHPGTLTVVGALSVVEQLVSVAVYWAIARSLELAIPLEALVVAVPLSLFAARVPVGIAGIGILEGGLVYLLGLYDVPGAQALSLSLTGRFVEFAAVLPGALWWRELTGRVRDEAPGEA